MDLESVRIYVRVAELGSFTQAAQQLKCPKATVSRTVLGLETRLGVRLLDRSTRSVALTPQGRRFLDRCRELLDQAEALARLFQDAATEDATPLQGRLRVDLPHGLAAALVLPRLPDFQRRHPGLLLDLSHPRADDDAPDCRLWLSDATPPAGLSSRPLGALPRISCASTAYLDALGWAETPQDLQGHRLVTVALDPAAGEGSAASAAFTWLDPANGRPRSVALAHALTVSSVDDALAACAAGLGIVQGPEAVLRHAVNEGRLVEVLPGWRPAPLPAALLYAERRPVPRRVQVFMDWLEAVMRPYLVTQAARSASLPRPVQPAAPAPAASGTASAR